MTSVRLAGNNFIIKFNIFLYFYIFMKSVVCRTSYVPVPGAYHYCIIPPPPYGTPGIPSRVQSRRTVLRTVRYVVCYPVCCQMYSRFKRTYYHYIHKQHLCSYCSAMILCVQFCFHAAVRG